MIDNKLHHHIGSHRRLEDLPVTRRMPGSPVLERGLVSARRVCRLSFVKKSAHRVRGLIVQARWVEQRRGRLAQKHGGRCEGVAHPSATIAGGGPLVTR